MKLYLATDALDDVRWATEGALTDGVVLPDSALTGAHSMDASLASFGDFVRAAAMPVFVLLEATTADAAQAEAERLGRAADHVVFQLPFAAPCISLMHRLGSACGKVAATFVGLAVQAMLAARTGVAFLFVDVDRIDAGGRDSATVLQQARTLPNPGACETDLVAVFQGLGASIVSCAAAGANAAVVGAAALRAVVANPFSDQSLLDPTRRPAEGQRLRITPS